MQYADYAAWQRGWLQGEVLEQQLGYWREQLGRRAAGAGAAHGPAAAGGADATAARVLPVRLPPALCGAAEGAGAARGRDAVHGAAGGVPGAAVALLGPGRTSSWARPSRAGRSAEMEGLIGFFVNTLVLRAQAGRSRRFRELLAQVRETTLGAYAHQDVPFEKLVEELQPERDLSRTPLFQVMFALQNAPMPEARLPGLTLRAGGAGGPDVEVRPDARA